MLGALKFNSAKCETTCRLCLGRIKLLKNKRNMQMKAYRKDIAELLKAGKQDYARIRVEAVIREALTLTAYEILELYLELLSVRASLVASSKEIPRDMIEALSSVLYAASRLPDLPELLTLHKMFAAKYGKEYVSEACSDVSCSRWMVNESLRRCLTIEPPEPALKLETLSEIAQEYGVEWDMDRARRELLPDHDGLLLPHDGASGGTGMLVFSSGHPGAGQQQQRQQQQQQLGFGGARPPAAAAGGSGYADVAAAAAAAATAAQQARAAAEAAARLAALGHGAGGGGGSGSSSTDRKGGGGGAAVAAAPVLMHGATTSSGSAPPHGWLAGMEGYQSLAQKPAATAAPGSNSAVSGSADVDTLQMLPLPSTTSGNEAAGGHTRHDSAPAVVAGPTGATTSGTSAVANSSGYRVPSSEEIQRAYDNAMGPPAKAASEPSLPAVAAATAGQAAGADLAPADQQGLHLTQTGPSDGSSSNGDLAGLPGVPHTGGDVGQSSSSGLSEYEELQRRFDALKKS